MTTCISAPGKVLLAGGYLVLDRAYSGVVISTSSRFYTTVRPAGVGRVNRILVQSPQFDSASWDYSARVVDRVYKVVPEDNSSRNKFVELALQRTLSLALEVSGVIVGKVLAEGLDIAIVGDNDFYSQRAALADAKLPPTRESLKAIKPFNKTGTAIKDVHKTGLGSSAALITSLVAALLVHFEVFPASHLSGDQSNSAAKDSRSLVHNLAQHVHCLAQGKVGSGFDVSAAVFGSQLYTRFSPAVLGPLMVDDLPAGSQLNPIISVNNTAWDYVVKPFQLPPRIKLMLADVDTGSDTPSLVGKVLRWRSSNQEEADALWAEIDSTNTALANQLAKLSDLASQESAEYDVAVNFLSSKRPQDWETAQSASHIIAALYETHKITELIRSYMRDMSGRTGVPIEPPEQTELLNACLDVPGVVGGGVPGAGGYDALWVLVLDPSTASEKPSDRVEQVWASWKKLNVSPLLAEESHTGGCRLEDVEKVPGLQTTIAV